MNIPNNWKWERHAYITTTTYIPEKNMDRFHHNTAVINKQFISVKAYDFIK